jgi:transposase
MPKPRAHYSAEYRERILDLLRSGRRPAEIAAEHEPCFTTIRAWRKQAENEGTGGGVTTSKRSELARLRREHEQLMTEVVILKAASAWLDGEIDAPPSVASSSAQGPLTPPDPVVEAP